jgi:threonine/homoserine/homoserine lactone efflux protein
MSPTNLAVISFLLAVPAVISPGPVSTAVVTAGARQGLRVGPLVSTGHAAMEFLMVLGLALGFSSLMQQPVLAGIIGLVGGALMLFMGLSLFWGVWKGKLSLPGVAEKEEAASAGSLIGLGVAATLTNPFWYGWWVSIGGACVAEARHLGWLVVVLFFGAHVSVDYIWNSFLAGVVGSGRRWINNTVYRLMLVAAGLFLLYIGVLFLLRAAAIFDLPIGIESQAGAAVCALNP